MITITVSHTTPDGNTFTYCITGITRRCWVIRAEHSGETRQYQGKAALRSFCRRLAEHLDAKYPAVEAGEVVTLAMAA
jgi:hypothetical protein